MASRVKVSYLSLDSFWRHNKDRHGRDLLSPWAHRIRRINSYSCMIPVISMTLSTDLSAIDLKNLLLLKANRKALLRATTQWIPTALLASHQLPVGAKEEKKDIHVHVKSILNICQISNSATLGRRTKTVMFQSFFSSLQTNCVQMVWRGKMT